MVLKSGSSWLKLKIRRTVFVPFLSLLTEKCPPPLSHTHRGGRGGEEDPYEPPLPNSSQFATIANGSNFSEWDVGLINPKSSDLNNIAFIRQNMLS